MMKLTLFAILRTRLKTSQLMLYSESLFFFPEIHTKHKNIRSVPRSKHIPSRLYKPVS